MKIEGDDFPLVLRIHLRESYSVAPASFLSSVKFVHGRGFVLDLDCNF